MFKPSFFVKNREELRSRTKTKLNVIAGNLYMQYGPDVTFPFRQDTYFWYLCGIETPGAVLVQAPKETFIIMPYQDRFDVISSGKHDLDLIKSMSGVDEVYEYRRGWDVLKKLLKAEKKVGVLGTKQRLERYLTTNGGRAALKQKIRRTRPSIESEDVRAQLVLQRMIKQPEEIKAIQRAVDIACEGFNEIAGAKIGAMHFEYEVEAFLAARFRQNGARQSFPASVVAGDRAHAIHYTDNNRALIPGQTLVVDMGAEVSNYASDISRTFVLGAPTPRQREVIEAVADVQRYAYSLLKPGVGRRDYELAVEDYMGDTLLKLKLITEKTRAQIRRYFTHATSHHMGLDVHDVADYSQPFAENMVLAVEPGIYIPQESIGVRIEDDVIVTKNGIRVLSKNLPATLI